MAIGTGTALLLGGAAAGLGTYLGGKSQQEAAKTGAQAAQQAQGTQQQMFQQGLELTQPYRDTGQQALRGLGAFMTPEGQAGMLNQYTGSDLYQNQLAQGEQARLRNASATGALRTSETGQALGALPAQLQQQYLGNQYNRLQGLAGLGLGAAQQGATGYQNLGANVGQLQQQQGAYQAQANQAMPMAMAGGLSDLGGLGLMYGMGGFGGGGNAAGGGSGFSYNPGSLP